MISKSNQMLRGLKLHVLMRWKYLLSIETTEKPLCVKGICQSVVVTNNLSTDDANQQLLDRFPNLGPQNVIVPRTVILARTISMNSQHKNATQIQNIGWAIGKTKTIEISGNEGLSVDDCEI